MIEQIFLTGCVILGVAFGLFLAVQCDALYIYKTRFVRWVQNNQECVHNNIPVAFSRERGLMIGPSSGWVLEKALSESQESSENSEYAYV